MQYENVFTFRSFAFEPANSSYLLMVMRRGIGVGAVRPPANANSSPTAGAASGVGVGGSSSGAASTSADFGRQLTERRLADIAHAAELLEAGIRRFVEGHKEEIRTNVFLREKVQGLADSCNVDLAAAVTPTPRLKPGALGSLLLGASADGSAAMKKFYSFLSSRVVVVCMRERVLRGPVVPLAVVLRELRKRYPLEDLSVNDIVKSIDFVAPLNPNLFVLQQETSSSAAAGSPMTEEDAADEASLFIAFRPLDPPQSVAHLLSDRGGSSSGAQGLSGSDALRVIVLANDIARQRRKRQQQAAATLRSATAGAGSFLGVGGASVLSAVSAQKQGGGAAAAAATDATTAAVPVVQIDSIGIVEAEQRGSFYVRITPADIVALLAPTSPTLHHVANSGSVIAAAGKVASAAASTSSTTNVPWTATRAKLALKAARSMHEGWYDPVDRSTWLLVLLQ
jgi:hypothetical protein